MSASLRLDRLLANLGYGTRSQAQQLLRARRVRLDGSVVDDGSLRIALTPDLSERMSVNGEKLDPPPGLALMLNKPCGVTCSHKEAGPLVYNLLPPRYRLREPPLSTVGRLDKETSGLLLITDDGALLHKIISPKNHVPKRYLATLESSLRGDEAGIFASGGLMLEGEEKPLLPATLEVVSPTSAYVTVTEGRYHQVRRMFAAVGNHVVALHRDRVGGLELPVSLAPGEFVGLGVAEAAAMVFSEAI
ncbi:pseudouridine synthase [Methylocella tundrae]|uniref:Pseudouridine synthase n=1 Tax=Methylocella tundrae TaxID=227605 RepID=A0A4U8Z5C2_METTU|nr:16S rRNA pseudouridine(516) synthase [Methylocella tundrae]WPP04366.1 16S rRNA pseudouridine(516) synthase [Methylocella tundrae]VFU10714.1 Ribosomal small subunit pseudouridine synthase A [Methylocella tundrae]